MEYGRQYVVFDKAKAYPRYLLTIRPVLRSLKVSELRKRALAGGASEEQLDEADDSGDTKAALVALVLAQQG